MASELSVWVYDDVNNYDLSSEMIIVSNDDLDET